MDDSTGIKHDDDIIEEDIDKADEFLSVKMKDDFTDDNTERGATININRQFKAVIGSVDKLLTKPDKFTVKIFFEVKSKYIYSIMIFYILSLI